MPIVSLLFRLRNLCSHNRSFAIFKGIRNQEWIAPDLLDLIVSKIICVAFSYDSADKFRVWHLVQDERRPILVILYSVEKFVVLFASLQNLFIHFNRNF